jgi:hypothetical protein
VDTQLNHQENQVKNHLSGTFFGLADHNRFIEGVQQAVNSINGVQGTYAGLIRNLLQQARPVSH